MAHHGDWMLRIVAGERGSGETRRRDQKGGARQQCAMLRTPIRDVDVRESRLLAQASRANRRIRFLFVNYTA